MALELKSLFLLVILGCPCFQAMNEKELRGMMDLERELLRNLRKYAAKLEEKRKLIDESVDEYNGEIEEASKDPELYLSHPLNAFRLIRHMHQDWVSWQVYMEKPVAPLEVENLELLLPQLPEREAYKQAAKEVQDLTQFYDYKPSDLVARNERNSALYMSPLDCYDLGLDRYEEQDYLGAAKWLSVAAENYTLSEYSDLYGLLGAPRWQVYRDQARALLKLNRPNVYKAYEKASNLNPLNVHLMNEVGQWELNSLRDPMEAINDPLPMPITLESHCRGDVVPERNRVCEYNDWASYFVEMAPIGLEVLVDTFMVLYPNSVYESELRHIEQAYHQCPSSDQFQVAEGITGCSISDGYSPTMRRIRRRVMDMTTMRRPWNSSFVVKYNSLKPLQVIELLRNSREFPELNVRGRLDVTSIAIIFLKNVTEGGAITMTEHELFVQPKRGNVLVSADGNHRELTICPNVVGSGLVMIKFELPDI